MKPNPWKECFQNDMGSYGKDGLTHLVTIRLPYMCVIWGTVVIHFLTCQCSGASFPCAKLFSLAYRPLASVTCSGRRRSTWETATPGVSLLRYFNRLALTSFKVLGTTFATPSSFGLQRQFIIYLLINQRKKTIFWHSLMYSYSGEGPPNTCSS